MSETAPTCPIHKTPMNKSKRGPGYYCTKKIGDDYCSEKWSPPTVSAAGAAPSGAPGEHLMAACLIYTALLYGKMDPDFHDEVFNSAMTAFEEAKKRL